MSRHPATIRRHTLAACLAAAALGLAAPRASAALLTPELELTLGPIASIPVTTGSVSIGGITAFGVPVVGSANRPELRLGGAVTLGGVFNPLTIEATEFDLTGAANPLALLASISGTLPPGTSVTWSAYLDTADNPFGTGMLLASRSLADPSTLTAIGFSVPPSLTSEPTAGPLALTEVVEIAGPPGATVSFNADTRAATASAVPEPGALALLGTGLLGLRLVRTRRRSVA